MSADSNLSPFQPWPDPDHEPVRTLGIGHRRYLVPVRNFDGPDELVPAHHVGPDGIVTDRRLIQWFPYPKFEPPRATALLLALDDPDFPDELTLEFGEYTNCRRHGSGWILIGSDAPDYPVRYFARVGNLPRGVLPT